MMVLFTKQHLHDYLEKGDSIMSNLSNLVDEKDHQFISTKWLFDSTPKRMIYQEIYGEYLKQKGNKSLLDIGGGYTPLTKLLIENNKYTLCDIMAHDNHDQFKKLELSINEPFWNNNDWLEVDQKKNFDIVIANDIFPNVDQRLSLFLDKFLPHCKELKLLLTYYNSSRFYKVKRIDAEEIFYVLAWDGEQVRNTLSPFSSRIKNYEPSLFEEKPLSLYENGRMVMYVKIDGYLS